MTVAAKDGLQLHHLSKTFKGQIAVQDLILEIKPRETMALLGPSGCGKSTTLQLIAGVLKPDQGTIHLGGRLLNRVPPERRGIAMILQKGILFPHLSVGENIAFGLKMRGISRAVREQQTIAMLERVQLPGIADRKPSELSGGQAQRVALARALVIQPQLLLLDEPLSALDANLRQEMQDLILDLQDQSGVMLLMVTHDQAEAVTMAQRIALMLEGRLHQIGSPMDFYQAPHSVAVARFFGGVNFWRGQAEGRRLIMTDGSVLTVERSTYGSVTCTIRPEQVQVFSQPLKQVNHLAAQLISQRWAGTQHRLRLRTAQGLELQAWISPTESFTPQQSVWVYLPPTAIWCLPDSLSKPVPSAVSVSPH